MNWRPKEGWENPHDVQQSDMGDGLVGFYFENAEYDAYEAGADAMHEAIMKARPDDSEIRVRIIEALYGEVSIPQLEKWLKEQLLMKP